MTASAVLAGFAAMIVCLGWVVAVFTPAGVTGLVLILTGCVGLAGAADRANL